MSKKTEFELRQHQRKNYLKSELEVVSKGNVRTKGTPIMAIHQIRIDKIERYLGL